MNQKQAKKAVKKLSIDKKDPKVRDTHNKNKSAEATKRAWEIARAGAAKFGGSASQYIGEAMKMAWKEIKQEANRPTEAKMYLQRLFKAIEEYENYTGNSNTKSISGPINEQASATRIRMLIESAIEDKGEVPVYEAIKEKFGLEKFEQMVRDLAYATYDSRYAVWAMGGGGAGLRAYEQDMASIIAAIGGSDPGFIK